MALYAAPVLTHARSVFYQAQFACVTAMLAAGAFADRARLGPVLVFIFCWTTIVYNPM